MLMMIIHTQFTVVQHTKQKHQQQQQTTISALTVSAVLQTSVPLFTQLFVYFSLPPFSILYSFKTLFDSFITFHFQTFLFHFIQISFLLFFFLTFFRNTLSSVTPSFHHTFLCQASNHTQIVCLISCAKRHEVILPGNTEMEVQQVCHPAFIF